MLIKLVIFFKILIFSPKYIIFQQNMYIFIYIILEKTTKMGGKNDANGETTRIGVGEKREFLRDLFTPVP